MPPISLPSFSINLSLPLTTQTAERLRPDPGRGRTGHLSPLGTLETRRIRTSDFVLLLLGVNVARPASRRAATATKRPSGGGLGFVSCSWFVGGEGKTRSPAAGTNGLATSCQEICFFPAAPHASGIRKRDEAPFIVVVLAARLVTHPETKRIIERRVQVSTWPLTRSLYLCTRRTSRTASRHRLGKIQKCCRNETNQKCNL